MVTRNSATCYRDLRRCPNGTSSYRWNWSSRTTSGRRSINSLRIGAHALNSLSFFSFY